MKLRINLVLLSIASILLIIVISMNGFFTPAYAQEPIILTETLTPTRDPFGFTMFSTVDFNRGDTVNCYALARDRLLYVPLTTLSTAVLSHIDNGSEKYRCTILLLSFQSDINYALNYDITSASVKFVTRSYSNPQPPSGFASCQAGIYSSVLSVQNLALQITGDASHTLPKFTCTNLSPTYQTHTFNIEPDSLLLDIIQLSRTDPAQNGSFLMGFTFNAIANFPSYLSLADFGNSFAYQLFIREDTNLNPTIILNYDLASVTTNFHYSSYTALQSFPTTQFNFDCARQSFSHIDISKTITTGFPSNCNTLAFTFDNLGLTPDGITKIRFDYPSSFNSPSPTCYLRIASAINDNTQLFIHANNSTQPSMSFPCYPHPIVYLSDELLTQAKDILNSPTADNNLVFLLTIYDAENPATPLASTATDYFRISISHPTQRVPPIFDLQGYSIDVSGIHLLWSPPPLIGHEIIGYEIYRGTDEYPDELIATVTDTSYFDDSELTTDNFYNYYILTLTRDRSNSEPSNILKIQLLQNLRIGHIDFTPQTSIPEASLLFESVANEGSTTVTLSRIQSLDLTCRYYTTTGLEDSLLPLNPDVIDNRLVDVFIFNGIDNDSVEIICKDQDNNRYSHPVTQGTENTIPIVKMLQNFSDGTFKTQGFVGSIDLVFIGIVFLSFIGFNRVNPILGVLTSTAIIFFAAWMGLLNVLPATITLIVLIIVTALVVTKK